MTVAHLISMLRGMPQQAQVYMSKDGEGNEFRPMDNCWTKGTFEDGDFTEDDDEGKDIALWPEW